MFAMAGLFAKMGSVKWYAGITVVTTLLIVIFSTLFIGLSKDLTENEIYDMSKTILSIDATLFGLSTLSGAIFLGMMKRREEMLGSRVLDFIALSFLCFWLALGSAFMSFVNPANKTAFQISIGSTLGGSLAGSVYLIYAFRDFLLSKNR